MRTPPARAPGMSLVAWCILALSVPGSVASHAAPVGVVLPQSPAPSGVAGPRADGAPTAALDPVAIAGVDPRVYLRARKPMPTAARELRALPIDVSLQILREGPEAFLIDPEALPSAYPAHLDATDVARLREREARALTTGALAAVATHAARSNPALAVEAIIPHLASADPRIRAEAALRLGQSGGGDSVVPLLLDAVQHDGDAHVRATACAGLGLVRSERALDALEGIITQGADEVVQAAAVRALASLGSRWAWQARGATDEGARLRSRALALIAALDEPGARPAVRAAVRAAVREARAMLRDRGVPSR